MAALSALGVLRALCQAGADVARHLLGQGDCSNAISLSVVKSLLISAYPWQVAKFLVCIGAQS